MSKSIKLYLVAIVLLVAGICFYFTPHLAAYNMKKAADNKDTEALSGYVDYPSLRESLKANFNAKIANEITKKEDKNPFNALGAAFAAALLNPMIDALVTPESLAMLMKGEKPQLNESRRSSSKTKSSSKESNTETTIFYKGFNRFVIKIKVKDSSEDHVELIFKRNQIL